MQLQSADGLNELASGARSAGRLQAREARTAGDVSSGGVCGGRWWWWGRGLWGVVGSVAAGGGARFTVPSVRHLPRAVVGATVQRRGTSPHHT